MKESIFNSKLNSIKEYFMRGSSYFTMEMPEYFDFDKMLVEIDKILPKDFNSIINSKLKPEYCDNVSCPIFYEKNSLLQWRKLILVNPILYVGLVNLITSKENWEQLKSRYCNLTSNTKIKCCSIPTISQNSKKTSILNWYNEFEQKTIELSMKYEYMAVTDITNCYSSIYTHSLSWAIEGKENAKKNRNSKTLGNMIDGFIQKMQYGQTNGLPEGNEVSNFLAEMLLAYIDNELSLKINYDDYYILRYRDDYRIFANDKCIIDEVLINLTKILNSVGMRLNSTKSIITDNILSLPIKVDKGRLICEAISLSGNMQNDIYRIWEFNERYNGSGQVKKLLTNYIKKYKKKFKTKLKNLNQIMAYIIDMALKNSQLYTYIFVILTSLRDEETKKYCRIIGEKFDKKPYSDYLMIWLQRVTMAYKIFDEKYDSKVCESINNNEVKIWNNSWSSKDFQKQINMCIDREKLKKVKKSISFDILDIFKEYE